MYTGLHVKWGPVRYFCPSLVALIYYRHIFEKSPNLYMPLRADLVNGSLYKIYICIIVEMKSNITTKSIISPKKHFGRKSKFTQIPHNAVRGPFGAGGGEVTCNLY